MAHLQRLAGAPFDGERDCVAMSAAEGNGLEYQQIQSALHEFKLMIRISSRHSTQGYDGFGSNVKGSCRFSC
jgi:hypothetical protein